MGLLSTVLGGALYVLLSLRLYLGARSGGAGPAWLALVPVANLALLFRAAGRSGWWAAAVLVPPAFFVALLAHWHPVAHGRGLLLGWWLAAIGVAAMVVGLAVDFALEQPTAGTLTLNVGRLLFFFGAWELLTPVASAGVRREVAPTPIPSTP